MLTVTEFLSRFPVRVVLGTVLLLSGNSADAQSGVATVVGEATIYEELGDHNGGGDVHYCIGNHDTGETRRGFLRFDLPEIPPGSVITRVVYDFTQNRVRRQCVVCTATMVMRRVTESWQEGTGSGPGAGPCGEGQAVAGVTWDNQPGVGDVSATESLPATDKTDITIDTEVGSDDDGLIADVQGWVDGGFSNFGWRIQVSEEATADNARRMEPGSMTIHWMEPSPLDFEDGFEDLP